MTENFDETAVVSELRQELRFLLEDVKAARREVDALRTEVRAEIVTLRSDMAALISRQNSAIQSDKKKSPGSPMVLQPSTGD